jgi:hypothetical protein
MARLVVYESRPELARIMIADVDSSVRPLCFEGGELGRKRRAETAEVAVQRRVRPSFEDRIADHLAVGVDVPNQPSSIHENDAKDWRRVAKERYRRIARRRGSKSRGAVGRVRACDHLASARQPATRCADLGSGFYDTRVNPERRRRNHIRQLEALGYTVTLDRVHSRGEVAATRHAGSLSLQLRLSMIDVCVRCA